MKKMCKVFKLCPVCGKKRRDALTSRLFGFRFYSGFPESRALVTVTA